MTEQAVELELGRRRRVTISEVFGPTLQGEGPDAGRPAIFVRFGLCNLTCSWCDTPYTWDWSGRNGVAYDKGMLDRVGVDEVLAKAAALAEPIAKADPMLVLTGGEPMIQVAALAELAKGWSGDVAVETNGTRPLDDDLWLIDRFVVSPKLASSGMDKETRLRPAVLRTFAEDRRAVFKFVIADDLDLAEVLLLVEDLDIAPTRVWLMPEGTTAAALAPQHCRVFDHAVRFGFNASTRLHVLAYDDKRGV